MFVALSVIPFVCHRFLNVFERELACAYVVRNLYNDQAKKIAIEQLVRPTPGWMKPQADTDCALLSVM